MATLCLRYTRNEHDAIEVLNSGFLKVFNNINRYEPAKASLYTWIRTIIINSCLDYIKAKQKLETFRELNNDMEMHVHPEVISKMKASELLELVRELPAATQAVFNLYIIEGYSHKEIAEMLEISIGTSKWHLSEGRKALQQKILYQQLKAHG
jgi:RNA polymerase sigma factor (sigma-70 family)